MLTEINIDALVGPTHHFGGLGVGNLASMSHQRQASQPKRAALEGVAKAALVARLGVPQFVWLPPLRPRFDLLSRYGFEGALGEQLSAAQRQAPRALSAIFSSAFMWAANAATVSPAVDTRDQRLHITPANLISSWHRATEANERALDIEELFQRGLPLVTVHPPLPSIMPLRDEGAANHMRLCDPFGRRGLNLFVYGEEDSGSEPACRFLPRQTRAACEAIARSHQLDPTTTFFLRQHPDAISAGVFHNDVIATSHQGLLIHHALAFWEGEECLRQIEAVFQSHTGKALLRLEISNAELPLALAVQSYFFNSQLLTPAGSDRMTLVCPAQCQTIEAARKLIERLIADPHVPIDSVHYVSLQESMANGGGPACLRLRVPIAIDLVDQLNPALRMDDALAECLQEAIDRWYPDSVTSDDLINPDFVTTARRGVSEVRRAVSTRR